MTDAQTPEMRDDAPVGTHLAPAYPADDAALEHIGRTVTIDRPESELRAFWREPANLALVFTESKVDWRAVHIEDAGDGVQWGAASNQADHGSGRVAFAPSPAGRGTEVTLTWTLPVRGPLTKAVEKLTKADPRMHSRRALRRFKQLMEAGEVSTAVRNSAGVNP